MDAQFQHTDAELLERYAVEGEAALADPAVAAVVAAHPALVREMDAALAMLRAPLRLGATGKGWERRRTARGQWLGVHPLRVSLIGALALAGLVIVSAVGIRAAITGRRVPTSVRTYATRTGQLATVTLDDGSRVTLAPRSSIEVHEEFGTGNRTVTLIGEALFTVSHSRGVPFIVQTGAIHTRVLGTAFDVRRYANERRAQVVVLQGRVAIDHGDAHGAPVIVSAGSVAQLGDDADAIILRDSIAMATSGSSVTPYTAWTRGKLDFSDTPLREALAEMESWYGYHFQLADSTLARKRLTGTFDYASRADMFRALEALLSISITLDAHGSDTIVTLRPQVKAVAPVRGRRELLNNSSHSTEVGR